MRGVRKKKVKDNFTALAFTTRTEYLVTEIEKTMGQGGLFLQGWGGVEEKAGDCFGHIESE